MKSEQNTVKNAYFMAFGNESAFDVPLPIEKLSDTTYNDDKPVPYGEDNLFPQRLLDLVEQTSLVETIIDKIYKFIYGKGVIIEGVDIDSNANPKMTWDELVRHIIKDYITFGAFALQVRRNLIGEIVHLDYIPVERLRSNEDNTKFWYKKRWTKFGKSDVMYNAFKNDPNQTTSIFYFKTNMRHVYGRAYWWSSIDDITILSAISDFDLSHVNNNFAPSAVVSFVEGIPTEDEQKEVEKKVNEKFSGARNASKAIFTFSDSAEGAPKITLLTPSDMTAQYNALLERVRDNVFAAFAMNSNLLGLKTTDGVFNTEQYNEIYNLFNRSQIEPMQKELKKAFDRLGYNLMFNAMEDNAAENNQNNTTENE